MELRILHEHSITESTMTFIQKLFGFRKPKFVFTRIKFGSIVVEGDLKMASMKENQEFDLTAAPKSASGKPTTIQQGTAEWTSSDESVATVTPDPANELSAKVKSVGVGEALITLKADGDTDEADTLEITGVEAVVVTAGNAVGFDLTASPVVDSATT